MPRTPDDFSFDFDDDYRYQTFANPGSALAKPTRGNARRCACPTCKRPNVLTPKDAAKGYQCDLCADIEEGAL